MKKDFCAFSERAVASDEKAQIIILTGFISTIALVAITVMLNDIIYSTNTASVETLQSTRFEFADALKQVKKEVSFARQAISDFGSYMEGFTLNISKLFAARGVAVEVNWSGVTDSGSVISKGDSVAYCGDKFKDPDFNLWNWMRDAGLNVTDYTYQDKCEKLADPAGASPTWRRPALLFQELCRDGGSAPANRECWRSGIVPLPVRNYAVAVFEWAKLRPKENSSVGPSQFQEVCQGHTNTADDGVLNHSDCLALMNFTAMGGKVIITSSEPSTTTNQTLVDALTGGPTATSGFNGYSPGGASTAVARGAGSEDDGRIANLTPLLKNYLVGDTVDFSGSGFIFPWVSGLRIYVCHKDDFSATAPNCAGAGQRGIAVSWCYRSGPTPPVPAGCSGDSASDAQSAHNIVYFPHLKGDLERSGAEILDDNLRPLFSIVPPGGSCAVIFKARDGTTTYNATINC